MLANVKVVQGECLPDMGVNWVGEVAYAETSPKQLQRGGVGMAEAGTAVSEAAARAWFAFTTLELCHWSRYCKHHVLIIS